MAKRSNTNKAVAKLLAIFLAIFGLAALSLAGLLTYYGKVVGTVNVQQSLVVGRKDGDTIVWKECSKGDYDRCTLDYRPINIVAGEIKDFNNTFYIKNNLSVEGTWDYVYFKWKYIIPRDLYDGLTTLEVYWTTYESRSSEPEYCGNKTSIPLNSPYLNCEGSLCTFEAPDRLGEGMIQKFCGVRLGLKPNTIPNSYEVIIEILPQQQ